MPVKSIYIASLISPSFGPCQHYIPIHGMQTHSIHQSYPVLLIPVLMLLPKHSVIVVKIYGGSNP